MYSHNLQIRTLLLTLIVCLFSNAEPRAEGVARKVIWGINGHPLSQASYSNIGLATQLDLLSELGCSIYRVDVPLGCNESAFDELLNLATARNIVILPVVCPRPSARDSIPGRYLYAQCFERARHLANRYHNSIKVWELDNELDSYALLNYGDILPDGSRWKTGVPDGKSPSHFESVRIQRCVHELLGLRDGILSVDPTATTIVNFSWVHAGFIDNLHSKGLDVNAVGLHWYSDMGKLLYLPSAATVSQVWVTEFGCRPDKKLSNDEVRATVKLFSNVPSLHSIVVYELLDEPHLGADNPEAHYGLVSVTEDEHSRRFNIGQRKPGFYLWQSIIRGSHLGSGLKTGTSSSPKRPAQERPYPVPPKS